MDTNTGNAATDTSDVVKATVTDALTNRMGEDRAANTVAEAASQDETWAMVRQVGHV